MTSTISAAAATAVLCLLATGCQTVREASLPDAKTQSYALKAENPARAAKPASAPAGDKRPYASLVAAHAKANGVPLDLAHAVIFSESTYNARARGAAGEIGLMQLRPATARMMGYSGSASGLYDPSTNIKYGMKYLGGAHKLAGGSTCGTILRYNAGHGARSMNPVSRAYCNKVSKLLAK